MAKFRVRAGKHTQQEDGEWVTYHAGQVVESDRPLDKLFAEKFNKLGKKDSTSDEDESEEDEEAVTDGGAGDVTSEFDGASEQDLKVFQIGKNRFNVFESDDLKKPLNKKPIKKTDVKKYIK